MANLLKEVWIQDIQELLYPNNSILLKSTDHSSFVHNNKVHVPNAGANPSVSKNRTVGSLPTVAASRTDNDLNYSIDSYSMDPVVISDLETYQIAYDKRKSVMYNALKNLETVVTNNFLYQIAPTSATTYTTGALSTGGLVFNQSGATATGSRSAVTLSDIFALKTKMDNDNIPDDGERILLVPANMFNSELLQIANVLQAYQLGALNLNESVVSTGVLAKVAGFNIMVRPTTVAYNTNASGGTSTLKAIDATGNAAAIATTDNNAILAWHPRFVSHAKGEIEVFYQEINPLYYGSVISFNVWEGATKLRSDNKGIYALVQSN